MLKVSIKKYKGFIVILCSKIFLPTIINKINYYKEKVALPFMLTFSELRIFYSLKINLCCQHFSLCEGIYKFIFNTYESFPLGLISLL